MAPGNYGDAVTTLFTSDMGVWDFLENLFAVIGTYSSALMAWSVILASPFAVLYLQQKSVVNLVIVYLFLGGAMAYHLPAQARAPALMMLTLGIVGLVYHIFYKDKW